jgi:hypothetical protein
MIKKTIILLLLIILISGFIYAQGEYLTMKIAVMGAGDELYFWWGHIALIIENTVTGRSNFYDYGLFSFDNENFFYNFTFGRLIYSCGVSPSSANLEGYIKTNRSVKIFTLDIPDKKKIEVLNFASHNVLPENRDYFYHHFRDNCSTRIRDIVDIMTDGQFKEQYINVPSPFTLRDHVRRHTWFSPAADWALNFWMGQVIDLPLTVWDDMFLPEEVGKRIDEFWYTDTDGEKRKLVTSVESYYKAHNRPAVLEVPKKQWQIQLTFSIVLSVIFSFFFYLQWKKIPIGRILCGFSMSLCGLVFGFASLLLYFMNLFTNHDYTFENSNMLFGTPLLLAAVPLGIYYALTKDQVKKIKYDVLLRIIWLLTVIGIFIYMAIKLLPWFWQDNLVDQLLMLPIALTFSLQPVGLKETIHKYLPFKKYQHLYNKKRR